MARIALCSALGLLGVGLDTGQRREYERAAAALFPSGTRSRELHFVGEVLAPPERDPRGDRVLLLRGAPEGGGHRHDFDVRFRVSTGGSGLADRTDALQPGGLVRVWGSLRPAVVRRPGTGDRSARRARHDAFGRVKSDLLVESHGGPGRRRIPSRMRLAARKRLDRALITSPDTGPLLHAMLLGEREGLGEEGRRALRDAGMLHLVAISGLHVGILVALLTAAGRRITLGRWTRSLVLLLLLAAYAPLVGPRPSVLRATVASSLMLLGRSCGREGDSVNALALIAAAVAAVDPAAARGPAFQLTFLATLGILSLSRPLARSLALPRVLGAGVSVSIAAYLATAPVVAAHFGHVAPIGVLSNLLAAPLCAAVLTSGYAAIGLADVPWVGDAMGRIAAGAAGAMLHLAAAAAEIPRGSFPVAPPATPVVIAYYGLLARLASRSGISSHAVRAVLLILVAWLHLGPPPSGDVAEATVLDVGQGLAVAVRGPEGGWILVDAGGRAATNFDPGERVVLPHLLSRGGRRVEALILSHGDVDHAGGASAVLREMEVGELWVGPGFHHSRRLQAVADLALRRGTALVLAERGVHREISGLPVRVVGPSRDLGGSAAGNDGSVVLLVGRAPVRLLLPGDLEREGERRLLDEARDLRAEALVASHHGSRSGSTTAFLARVAPRWSMVSCGRGNPFRHPHVATRRRLRAAGSVLLRTDLLGPVTLRAGAGGWRFVARDP